MKRLQLLVIGIVVCLLAMQSGCAVINETKCRNVQYYKKQPTIFAKYCTNIFSNPCPTVCVPKFFKSNLDCLEREKRLSALRERGVGVIVLGDRLRFIIPTDTFFDADKVNLNDCSLGTIAAIADIIECLPCVPVSISGHTDDVGTKADKLRHSWTLAQTVAAHLWASGINWERMRISGCADCNPIASNNSVFGSTDNRRVEIRLDFSGNCRYNGRYNNRYCPECMGY
jgi:outer membrane protein OmpA-like peptidoglycan-associated protein